MYRCTPFRSTLNTNVITALGNPFCIALSTRTLSLLWTRANYVRKESIPLSTNVITALGMCKVCTEAVHSVALGTVTRKLSQLCKFGHVWGMYRSSPFRSTLKANVITALGMCKVCTEAVRSVALQHFWFQHENGFTQQALIHSQRHENAKWRKQENAKTRKRRKRENDENAKTRKRRKRENAKTRIRENVKTRKRENDENAKTRKRAKQENRFCRKQKNTTANQTSDQTRTEIGKTRQDENAKTRKRENGQKCSR